MFVDRRAHKTIYEGAELATLRGATAEPLRARRSRRARAPAAERYVVGAADLHRRREQHDRAMRRPRRRTPRSRAKYDAILYVDDAHGFGVIGERSHDELSPYGMRGNSIVRHLGESYENIVLVAGLSKAYSSLAAFIACPTEMKRLLKTAAPPYLYSGPSPVASLATTIAGLEVNDRRGDATAHRPLGEDAARARRARHARRATRRTRTGSRSSRCRSHSPSRSETSASSCSTTAST